MAKENIWCCPLACIHTLKENVSVQGAWKKRQRQEIVIREQDREIGRQKQGEGKRYKGEETRKFAAEDKGLPVDGEETDVAQKKMTVYKVQCKNPYQDELFNFNWAC